MSDQFNDGFDHEFLAIHDSDIEWEEDLANELLTLPKGVKAKVFAHDKKMGRIDMKVKFPPGYVEPAHSHKSWHSILVLKGRMCVDGKDLRPGDYIFGWDKLHGPYEYPDGAEAFVVFLGEGTEHIWDADTHNSHQKIWEPETEEGKQAKK
jgi:hypothetical protein